MKRCVPVKGLYKALVAAIFGLAACCPCTQPPPVAMTATAGESPAAPMKSTPTSDPTASAIPGDGVWWDSPYPERFDGSAIPQTLGFISVKGNRFVDDAGATVIFQGVSIADPDKLRLEGHLDRKLFEVIKSWGANVVRIPVHPAAWRGLGKSAYFELLDEIVVWATELELYLIIDWHSIGNLVTGMFQHPMYDTTRQETYEFWRSIAHRYQGISTVAFYEIFNEPTVYNGTLGQVTWEAWKGINEEIIDIIYAHDKQVIPLVGGFNWAYELGPVAKAPIAREGIGYVSHPYPQKVEAPFKEKWDASFGFVAKTYPLFATEIGYMRANDPGAHIPVMDDGTYGKRMTDYLAEKGASWVAWCFHPDWAPPLIADWDFTPTESGAHFREVMQARPSIRRVP